MFQTASRRQWRTKGNKSGSIGKETDKNPGVSVLLDQLQSNQTILVPQLLGKLTGVCSWASQVMVDHFSELTYVKIMRSTSQEETLAVK